MGQYLACGIAVQINVYCNSKTEKKDINDLEKIKNHLNNYFSIDDYELDKDMHGDSFLFTIKKNYLEENIHNTIREVSNLFYLQFDRIFPKLNGEIDFQSKEFSKKEYRLELKHIEECGEKYLRIVSEDGFLNDFGSSYDPTWLYRQSSLFGWDGKYRVYIDSAAIWIDIDKYDGEDETNMLFALNSMKNSYFKEPLSKDLFFYIFG